MGLFTNIATHDISRKGSKSKITKKELPNSKLLLPSLDMEILACVAVVNDPMGHTLAR